MQLYDKGDRSGSLLILKGIYRAVNCQKRNFLPRENVKNGLDEKSSTYVMVTEVQDISNSRKVRPFFEQCMT